jgi:hypothetical protein
MHTDGYTHREDECPQETRNMGIKDEMWKVNVEDRPTDHVSS